MSALEQFCQAMRRLGLIEKAFPLTNLWLVLYSTNHEKRIEP